MALVAGVDSSTQSTKVLIVNTDNGAVVRMGTCPHPSGTEVDPNEWLTALRTAIQKAGGISDVSSISIAGQQHGLVALDANGDIIRPALLWNDTRSGPGAAALVDELGPEFWAKATGSVPVASLTVSKLRFLADSEPHNAARIKAICLPHDWLTWKLSGSTRLSELTTDRSDASGTGYVDCSTDEYRYDILAHALHITTEKAKDIILPRIVPYNQSVGTVAQEWITDKPSRQQILIGPGMGDNAGSAFGHNLQTNQASISIGTSGVIATISDTPIQDPRFGVTGFSDATDKWLPLACTLNGALIQDYFRKILNVSFEELGTLAERAQPGAQGVTLVPYFQGERTPNLPYATAHIAGLTSHNFTRENLARAAYEGLACLMRGALEALRGGGISVNDAMLIGGGAQSETLNQILADVLEIPISVPRTSEYVARGAARQAAVVAGIPENTNSWSPDITQTYKPRENESVWERYRAVSESIRKSYPTFRPESA